MYPFPMDNLYFLKLGGSLITDKDQERTVRQEILHQLAAEIKSALDLNPSLKLVIGHGSGSFGHPSASRHKTRQGVQTPRQWLGFAEVWKDARDLNQRVINTLSEAALPVLSFPPSSWLTTRNRLIQQSFTAPILSALHAGLIPVIQGDVIFDQSLGGTILSTEEVFTHLARTFHPCRILLAGIEAGIWDSFPARERVIPEITPANLPQVVRSLSGSSSVDVTGGMIQKVNTMMTLLAVNPGLKISIFSGLQPGTLRSALLGEFPGTTLSTP